MLSTIMTLLLESGTWPATILACYSQMVRLQIAAL